MPCKVYSTTPTPARLPTSRHPTCIRTTGKSTPSACARQWRRAGKTDLESSGQKSGLVVFQRYGGIWHYWHGRSRLTTCFEDSGGQGVLRLFGSVLTCAGIRIVYIEDLAASVPLVTARQTRTVVTWSSHIYSIISISMPFFLVAKSSGFKTVSQSVCIYES